MKAYLAACWVLLAILCAFTLLLDIARHDYWRTFGMMFAIVLLVLLRRDLTEQP